MLLFMTLDQQLNACFKLLKINDKIGLYLITIVALNVIVSEIQKKLKLNWKFHL